MRAHILAVSFAILAAYILLPAPPVRALPEEIRLEGGDPAVNGSFLRPYTNKWKFSIQKPGAEPVDAGVWTDRLETTTDHGRPALKRTQVAEYKKGIRLTFVSVFDPKTMALLTFDYERSDTGETRHLELHGRTARFRRLPGTGSETAQDYTARLEHEVLDFYDGLYGILLDAFPLQEGYAVTFPALDTDRASIDWVRLRVAGRETITGPGGKRFDSWVVRLESRLYDSSTWWLTREAPYVLKAILVQPDSEGGATITYTMI
jgi:uncharacterized protein DUF3108